MLFNTFMQDVISWCLLWPNFVGLCYWNLPTWTWSSGTITCNIFMKRNLNFSCFYSKVQFLVIVGQHRLGDRSDHWTCSWRLPRTGIYSRECNNFRLWFIRNRNAILVRQPAEKFPDIFSPDSFFGRYSFFYRN